MLNNKNIFIDTPSWERYWREIYVPHKRNIIICTRCLYDADMPNIEFDEEGVCNYCRMHDQLCEQFPGGEKGVKEFDVIVKEIKEAGKNKKYDVVVGVSGGADSSYMIYLAKEYGLRPLAVHFDNTWDSQVAVENIYNVLNELQVDLYTHVADNEEIDDLYRAILRSGVPDLEAPTDLAIASVLNQAAGKYGVRYIFEGHSFKTEGLSPLGWLYMDSKYVQDIYKRHGDGKKLRKIPQMELVSQLKWMLINRFRKIRPLWYLDYNKAQAKELLQRKFGWQWYGGHHLENRTSNFFHAYFFPRRFGFDGRVIGYAAMVRSGQLDRNEGFRLLEEPPLMDTILLEMMLKRWGLSEGDFVELMMLPKRSYLDYKTYKSTFEKMRPFFYLMAKRELIPWSFYVKYTSKSNI